MKNNEMTFYAVFDKMKQIEKKIDAVIFRLEICQKYTQKGCSQSQGNEGRNTLDQYLRKQDTQSYLPDLTARKISQEMLLAQSGWKSFPEKMAARNMNIDRTEEKSDHLDSRSFKMIKRSILTNSEEIELMKERMIEVENEYLGKIAGVQEGLGIVSRLCEMMQAKISELWEKKQDLKQQSKGSNNRDEYRLSKLVQKYQREEIKGIDYDPYRRYNI